MIKNILAVAIVVALSACSSGSDNDGDNGAGNGTDNGAGKATILIMVLVVALVTAPAALETSSLKTPLYRPVVARGLLPAQRQVHTSAFWVRMMVCSLLTTITK